MKPTIWDSLGLSELQSALLGGAAVVAVGGLLVVIWQTKPVQLDEQAVPIARVAGTVAPPAVAATPPRPSDSSETVASPVEPFERAAVALPAETKSEPVDVPALEATVALYDQELTKQPDNADVFNRKGQVLERLGRTSEAATCFERASALSPDTRIYHFNLARVANALGQSDRAVAAYREVVRLQPQDYAAQYVLAMALQKAGDDEAAVSELQKTVALDSRDANVHLALGVSLERVGRIADAVPHYQQYIAMRPDSVDAERLKEHLAKLAAHP